jgi:hypothetical protein
MVTFLQQLQSVHSFVTMNFEPQLSMNTPIQMSYRVITASTVSNSMHTARLDANTDGYDDLWISNSAGTQNQLMLGDGLGGFVEAINAVAGIDGVTATSEFTQHTAVLDVNGDWHMDLYLSNRGENQLLLGDGTGIFTNATAGLPVTTRSLGSSYHAAVLDANGDTHADLYVSNYDDNQLLLGQGNGIFTERWRTSGGISRHAAVLDANFDGHADLWISNSAGSRNQLLLGEGTGGFINAWGAFVSMHNRDSRHTAVIDADGDNCADLYISNYDNQLFIGDFSSIRSTNQLFMGNGKGDFTESSDNAAVTSVRESVHSIVLDANGDSHADLYVSNGIKKNQLFLGHGNTAFTESTDGVSVNGIGDSQHAVALDANEDGRTDFYVSQNSGNNELFVVESKGKYTEVADGDAVISGRDSQHTVVVDVNGDSHADLFVANYRANNYIGRSGKRQLFIGNGKGDFVEVTDGPAVTSGGESCHTAAIDANGDGSIDLYVTNADASNQMFLGNGNGEFTELLPTLGGYARHAAVLDANGDAISDLYISKYGNNQLLLGDGAGSFADAYWSGSAVTSDRQSHHAAVLDCNGDGNDDLYVSNYGNNQLLLSDGTGTFTEVSDDDAVTSGGISYHAAILDANGDFYNDLYVSNDGENQLFLGYIEMKWTDMSSIGPVVSASGFIEATDRFAVNVGGTSYHAAVFDANGDSHNDLYVSNGGGNKLLLGHSSDDPFTKITDSVLVSSSGGSSRHAAVLEANGDGFNDIYLSRDFGEQNLLFVFKLCPDGYRRPSTWSSMCLACPEFGIAVPHGAVNECQFCPGGRVGPEKLVPVSPFKEFMCLPCDAGTYRGETNMTRCTTCESGQYALSGASECSVCEPGRVTNRDNARCVACLKGKQTNPERTACNFCEPGYFSMKSGAPCSPCDEGSLKQRIKPGFYIADGRPWDSIKVCPGGPQAAAPICPLSGLWIHAGDLLYVLYVFTCVTPLCGPRR